MQKYMESGQRIFTILQVKSFSVHFLGSKITAGAAGSAGATCHFSSRLAADVKGLISRLARRGWLRRLNAI
jgi:hypothetical protein